MIDSRDMNESLVANDWGSAGICQEIYILKGFPPDVNGKQPSCQCGRQKRHGFNPSVRKIPEGGHDNQLQYSCLEIPWTEEPHRLKSTGSHRVGQDSSDLARMIHFKTGYDTSENVLMRAHKPKRIYLLGRERTEFGSQTGCEGSLKENGYVDMCG